MEIAKKILLFGGSGHSKVICSIFESLNYIIEGFFDDNLYAQYVNHYKYFGKYDKEILLNLPIVICVGDNHIRKSLTNIINHKYIIAIHPSSIVDKFVDIGLGSVIMHNAIIQRDSIIGKHCIINTNASIDHDCIINDFVHISPSATLCGNVKVGEGTHIGAGATIIPNITIGEWCVIGAGAVITKDVPDYSLVVGIPGKIIKTLKND
jgi:sugar O-acyltransferase (sialic acid O-acetyltransferase NeuD family)